MSCLQETVAETKVDEEESPVPSPLPNVEMLPPETADKRLAMLLIPVCTLLCALGYGLTFTKINCLNSTLLCALGYGNFAPKELLRLLRYGARESLVLSLPSRGVALFNIGTTITYSSTVST